jgi:hypothetical protein
MGIKHWMTALWVAGMVVCGTQDLSAQTGTVEHIRETYAEVNIGIGQCSGKSPEACGYFLTTIAVNAQQHPWPDVGIYHVTTQLWSTIVPSTEGEAVGLRKVNVETARSDRQEHEEYLFDDQGQLMFYYFKLTMEKDVLAEHRFYFSDGALIAYKEKVVADEAEPRNYAESDAGQVRKQGAAMQDLFKSSLN